MSKSSLSLKFECTICHDKFPTSFGRSSHLSKNHLDLLCRQCNRYYLSPGSLQQHYRADPSHPSCPQCNEGFPNGSSLSVHLSAVHPPELCEPCGIVFKDKKLLEVHYKESVAHPTCVLCDIGLLDSLHFDQHVQTYHPSLYCDVCAVGFQSSEQLLSHFRESEWKQHPTCVICNEGFKDHGAYNEHMVSRHPPTPTNLSPTMSTPPSSVSLISSILCLEGQASFVCCAKCNKNYSSADDLTRHYKRSSVHPTCVQCGTGLFDDLAFLEHKIVAHKHSRAGSPTGSHDLRSLDGIFAFDEDLTRADADKQAFTHAPEASNQNYLQGVDKAHRLYSMPNRQISPQPSPIASSYLTTSLYLDEEIHDLSEDFEIVQGLDAGPSSTPRRPISGQSLSYRSAPSTPVSDPSAFSESLSSIRRSNDEPGTGFVTPYFVQSDRGTSLSRNLHEEHPSGSINISDVARRRASASPSESAISIRSPPCASRPPTAQDGPSHSPEKPLRLETRSVKNSISDPAHPRAIRSSSSEHDTEDVAERNGNPPAKASPAPLSSRSETAGSVAKVNPSWICRVCLKEPSEPTATICGHIFCHRCIAAELSKSLQCPACKRSLLISLFLENA